MLQAAAKAIPLIARGSKDALALSKNLGKAAENASAIGSNIASFSRGFFGLLKQVSSFTNAWMEIQDISFKTARTMGLSREAAMKMDRALMQEIKELGRAYGTSSREIAEYQKKYSEATGRNIQLTKTQMEQMVALGNITDNATASKLVEEFDNLGVNIEDTLAYTGQLQERAKYLGLNATKASEKLAENIKLSASYSFRNGIDDIQRMVLKSQALKMNMQSIMTAADKFSTISSAIETSANVQMLGGSFAANFSNPMTAMYESMADPAAFQDRLIKTIAGKGTYDKKTNQVTFDPVTMMTMKAFAQQMGVSVDEFTKSAMAMAQNEAVDKEIKGNWSKEDRLAIQELSRSNFDEKTGKHFVTYTDTAGNTQQVNVEDLNKEQLEQARDSAMTQDKMWADVHTIKEVITHGTMGRARETRSTKENLKGFSESVSGFQAQLENLFMPTTSGVVNGGNGPFGKMFSWIGNLPFFGGNSFTSLPVLGPDSGINHYAEGGIVKPMQHAAEGAIVGGDSYYGDNVPIMANSGEVVINKQQQSGLMNLLSMMGKLGATAYIGNALGRRMGMGRLGYKGLGLSLMNGGNVMQSMLQMAILSRFGPIGGMLMGMDPISAMMFSRGGFGKMKGLFGRGTANGAKAASKGSFWKHFGIDAKKDAKGRWKDSKGRFTKAPMKQLFPDTYKQFQGFNKSLDKVRGKITAFGNKFEPVTKRLDKFGNKVKAVNRLGLRRGRHVATAVKDYASNTRIGRIGAKGINKVKGIGSSVKSLGGSMASDAKNLLKEKGLIKANAKATSGAAKALGETAKNSKLLNIGGKLLKSGGGKALAKRLPVIGSAIAIGMAASDFVNATDKYDAQEAKIRNSNLSESEKQSAIDANTDEKRGAQGKAVGSAIGGVAGASLGAAIGTAILPGLGTAVGTVAGAWLGDKVGGAIGSLAKPLNKMARGVGKFLFGDDSKAKASFSEEELADPQLTEKADAATIKIYELLLKKENVGFVGKAAKSIGSVVTAPFQVAAGIGSAFGNLAAAKNNPEVSSIPVVGQRQVVKDRDQSRYNIGPSNIGPQDINLNVSGTIKLDLGGKQSGLDVNKLLDSPQFKAQLTDIISRRLNDMGNGGKYNKEGKVLNTQRMYNTVK